MSKKTADMGTKSPSVKKSIHKKKTAGGLSTKGGLDAKQAAAAAGLGGVTPTKGGVKVKDKLKKKKKEATAREKTGASAAIDRDVVGDETNESGDPSEAMCRLFQQSYFKSIKAESASFLETEEFTGVPLSQLPSRKTLQGKLNAAESAWGFSLCQPNRPCKGGVVGSPSVLILTSSAVRALEVIRQLPTVGRACRIHKLFSKHMKVEEQAKLLKLHLCIAVGTPNRIDKLAGMEALQLSKLRLVLVDMQPDVKKRTLLDIPETRDDFWSLYRNHISTWLAETNGAKLCVFRDGL